MSSRTPAADHYAEIAKRVTEIQTERMQAIAGCVCPVDMLDQKQHVYNCPLAPQLSVTIVRGAVAIYQQPSSGMKELKRLMVEYRVSRGNQ